MEKNNEKTPEQIFGEKVSPSDKKSKPTKSTWIKESVNQKNNSDKINAYFQDILTRTPKEKLENKEIHFELPSLNSLTGLSKDTKKVELEDTFKETNPTSKEIQQSTSSETAQYQHMISSLRAENAEYQRKMESMVPEIEQYQNIINLLRAEIAKHEDKKPIVTNEITLYKQLIHMLRAEIAEYQRKMESMLPEIERYNQTINSLKSGIYQNKHEKPFVTSNEIGQFQILINSLRTELAEYKNKVELLSSERNQQNSIDALRAELAEYKNKVELLSSERNQQNSIDALRAELAEYRKTGSMQSAAKSENMIKSLNIEISRLKNNLDSMILK